MVFFEFVRKLEYAKRRIFLCQKSKKSYYINIEISKSVDFTSVFNVYRKQISTDNVVL